MPNKRRPITVVCSEQPGSMESVVSRLQHIGFVVEQELEFAGSVIGQWDGDLKKIQEIPGVDGVEGSEEMFPLA